MLFINFYFVFLESLLYIYSDLEIRIKNQITESRKVIPLTNVVDTILLPLIVFDLVNFGFW